MACLGNRSATTEMASWLVGVESQRLMLLLVLAFQAGDADEKRQLAVGMLPVLLADFAGQQQGQ